jgi:hypothetical protein
MVLYTHGFLFFSNRVVKFIIFFFSCTLFESFEITSTLFFLLGVFFFWLLLLFHSSTFIIGILLLKLWLVIGLYGELEGKKPLKTYQNMTLACVISFLMICLVGYLGSQVINFDLEQHVQTLFASSVQDSVKNLLPGSLVVLIPGVLFF